VWLFLFLSPKRRLDHSPQEGNQLRGLREHGDGLKRDLCRDGGLGLLARRAVVRAYALDRAGLGLLNGGRHRRRRGVRGRGDLDVLAAEKWRGIYVFHQITNKFLPCFQISL